MKFIHLVINETMQQAKCNMQPYCILCLQYTDKPQDGSQDGSNVCKPFHLVGYNRLIGQSLLVYRFMTQYSFHDSVYYSVSKIKILYFLISFTIKCTLTIATMVIREGFCTTEMLPKH